MNATDLFVYKLRNYRDLEAMVEELQAMLPSKKDLLEIYHMATHEPYSSLFVHLRAKTLNDTFMINFQKRIKID